MACPDDWKMWLTAVGAPELASGRSLVFESSSLAYEAAIKGLGVVMAQKVLIEPDLAEGTLSMPFDAVIPAGRDYYLVTPRGGRELRQVSCFREWLLAEAREMPDPAAPAPARAKTKTAPRALMGRARAAAGVAKDLVV
jgi:LysR family glycine cleavage system transcriptional activator